MEKKILRFFLPEGYSVLGQTIDTSAAPAPEVINFRELKLRIRILEAIDSLTEEGITEQTGYVIKTRMDELHPPKSRLGEIGHASLFQALQALEENGTLVVQTRTNLAALDDKGERKTRYFYARAPQKPIEEKK